MKRLNEQAIEILETYLSEDESIYKLYENEVVNEKDILELHEALSILDEWDELLSELTLGDAKGLKQTIGEYFRGKSFLYKKCRQFTDPIKRQRCKVSAVDKVIKELRSDLNKNKNKMTQRSINASKSAITALEKEKGKQKAKLEAIGTR
ncbi:MAG: hypothetical protein ACOCQD_02830 [archaeon]